MWLTSMIFAGVVALAPNQRESSQDEDQRSLDEVIVEGSPLSEEAEQLGTLMFRPLLAPTRKRDPETRTQRIDFIFSPVVLDDTGTAIAYTGDGRTRFVSSLRVPQANSSVYATNFDPNTPAARYKTQSANLRAGTYVLSEIVYNYEETRIIGRFGPNGTTPPPVQITPRTVRYCLSDGTFLLDVENEITQFIGAVALADLPTNSARYPQHTPIIALNRDLTELNIDPEQTGNLVAVSMDASKFIPSADMCTDDAHHVAAWSPSEPAE